MEKPHHYPNKLIKGTRCNQVAKWDQRESVSKPLRNVQSRAIGFYSTSRTTRTSIRTRFITCFGFTT